MTSIKKTNNKCFMQTVATGCWEKCFVYFIIFDLVYLTSTINTESRK